MKKLYSILALLLLAITVWAQSPQKMSYQAVVRDEGNSLVINRPVGVKMSIVQGSGNGNTVYSELFNPNPETNANGLLTLEIGGGIPVLGTFSEIDWSKGPFFIRTEIDPSGGSNYTVNGTSPLLSVPFALHAHSVENDKVDDADNDPNNEIQQLSLNGTSLTLSRGGGSVTLPSSGGGDNWGTQSVVSDATLDGTGTNASPLKLADNAVTATKIANSAVTGTKIAQAGASSGQVLKWNGTQWSPGEDEAGEGGLTLPFTGSAENSPIAFSISGALTGILGESLNTFDSELNIGIHGKAIMNQWSRGVFGEGSYAGIWGESNNYGVYGRGSTGIFGVANNSNGYSGYFTTGKFYVQGKVGIGILTPVTSLHVRHGVLATNAPEPVEGLRLHNSGANNNSWTLYTVNSNGNLQFYANNTLRGTFSATSGTYTSSSNRRLKTDITTLGEDILKRALQLEPVSYRFKSNPQSEPTIGFIAEDVQPLFPELVEITGENDENLGVNYAAFSVVAIKAIQQQQKQMEELQSENEQLKKRLDRLENLVASTAQKGND
ncbi:tail fiber domain-containing protein [Mariniphaga sp.]|uniref:tail fiber domain-containing protein n=1 Tax=Mariniphaga sp. TaxID=1954475 RepID=UPI003566B674